MKTSEKEIILSFAKLAILQYRKAIEGEPIYRDQKAVRAAIVHEYEILLNRLHIDLKDVEKGSFWQSSTCFDSAFSDSQEAFQ
jgi:hypothetical protein